MIINKNKVVSISYELRVNAKDGDLVEKVEASQPMLYLHGAGTMLEGFEAKLAGLKKDDTFDFMLESAEAYGDASEEAVMDLPKSVFEVEGQIDEDLLVLDNIIPMQDKDGNSYQGLVIDIKEDTVTLDFNHPLAGDSLFFTGTVIEVRDASAEELAHGHVHQPGGHHHHGHNHDHGDEGCCQDEGSNKKGCGCHH